ncbi:hypothetical protein [Peribacillus loiseleuriae]|nr:hypothetical protein [Peribacillus loiseleuriae]
MKSVMGLPVLDRQTGLRRVNRKSRSKSGGTGAVVSYFGAQN